MSALPDGLRRRSRPVSSTNSLGIFAPVKLSRESEYGLEGLRVLARQPQRTVMLLQEIAEAGHLPPRFLAQIFQKLRRHHVVSSHRGAVRGYSLARPSREITLREIFEAIEGPDLFARCIFWPGRCDDKNPCRLHTTLAELRSKLQELLNRTTLEEVASEAPGLPRKRQSKRRLGPAWQPFEASLRVTEGR